MNTNNQTETLSSGNDNYDIVRGYISIEISEQDWRTAFAMTMLRLARVILAKDYESRNLSAERVSKLMVRHLKETGCYYSAMDIRERLYCFEGEINGGGYEVMWDRSDKPYHRRNGFPHFDICFYRNNRTEACEMKSSLPINPTTEASNSTTITQ